jgi:Zn-dependent protease
MTFFAQPPITRYDLNFRIAGIPVRVHPLFWLMGLLFASSSRNLVNILIWIVAIFVSILIHELGHALVMRVYGIKSQVILYVMGGLTVPESVWWGDKTVNISLNSKQENLVSFAGAGAGFLLAGLVMAISILMGGTIFTTSLFGVIPFPIVSLPWGGQLLSAFVMSMIWINIFWGVINLMPVYPLDGGNIARRLFVQADPYDGLRKSLWVSTIVGGVIAVVGLILLSSFYMAFLFGILAVQSYLALRGKPGIPL